MDKKNTELLWVAIFLIIGVFTLVIIQAIGSYELEKENKSLNFGLSKLSNTSQQLSGSLALSICQYRTNGLMNNYTSQLKYNNGTAEISILCFSNEGKKITHEGMEYGGIEFLIPLYEVEGIE